MSRPIEELKKRAAEGLTGSQIALGHCYLTGRDSDGNEFPQDYAKAKYWLECAHTKGAFTATVILGTMYEEGKGIPVDICKAIELYEMAAERGAYLPCLYLARIFAQGKGVEKSPQIAAKWYQKVLLFDDDPVAVNEAQEFLRSYGHSEPA
jgi:TPR repeat protein